MRGGHNRTADGRVPPPDASITAMEDAIHSGENKLQMLSLEQTFPRRPGYGTRGSPVVLWANYVQMKTQDLLLHRYGVSVSPVAVGKKLNQIIWLLVESNDLAGLRQDVVTDFKSTLLSREKLPDDETVVHIVYRAEGEDEPREKAIRYKVRVKFTHSLSMRELTEYLTSTNLTSQYNDKLPMIQSFNILLKHYSKEAGNLATIGTSKTFSLGQGSEKFDLGRGLEAIRGFFASVRAATGRVLVNVNVSNAAFYKSGPLDDLMTAFMQSGNKFRLESFLKRVRIRTTHLKERKNKKGEVIPRIKTIHGLASTNDGSGLAHPPHVPAYGAGPKQVRFWLEGQAQGQSQGQGKGKKQNVGRDKSGEAGDISVYEFFVKGKSTILRLIGLCFGRLPFT
jgi:eukaryotic translation initiation factor 2C